MGIWVYDRESGQVQPVPNGADARYPVWLGSAETIFIPADELLPALEEAITSTVSISSTEIVSPTVP